MIKKKYINFVWDEKENLGDDLLKIFLGNMVERNLYWIIYVSTTKDPQILFQQ